ncbi:hypothetical protein [Thermodesulfobacterium hveragerdense]|uniref:hypothetical protein n=1 Tax=Thermodesulfobacterium hveragerdense TaxID=53424 RepID=UPI00041AA4BC|nr:hypothetical protein [Thermodesulfobacterium hveragerdense]
MRILGLDVGSTYIKVALFENERLTLLERDKTSYQPLERCLQYINKYKPDQVVATGDTCQENCVSL